MAERVLVLAAPFGCGHLQAARAIAEACREQDPGCEATVMNVDTWVLRRVAAGYLSLLRHAPGLYRRMYHGSPGPVSRRLMRSALCAGLAQRIMDFKPTRVVATHPFPGAVASALRATRRLNAPVSAVVTDFIPHPLWVEPGIDRFFVPTEGAGARLAALGIAPDRICVTGMPIRSEFTPGKPAGDAARHILVMGGGLGLGPIVEAIRSLAVLPHPNLRVTAVCGTNERLCAELTDLFADDPRFNIIGYSPLIPQLMARADLLITKPGGITAGEALAAQLPMLLLRPLPGQEEENAAYLEGAGAALPVADDQIGSTAASLLFASPEKLTRMREAARIAGRPDAARLIARDLLGMQQRQRRCSPCLPSFSSSTRMPLYDASSGSI